MKDYKPTIDRINKENHKEDLASALLAVILGSLAIITFVTIGVVLMP